MSTSIFHSPFTTALSGSARETEDRIRNIFQYQKKRPPVPALLLACALALSCGSLVSCQAQETGTDIPFSNFTALPGEPLDVVIPTTSAQDYNDTNIAFLDNLAANGLSSLKQSAVQRQNSYAFTSIPHWYSSKMLVSNACPGCQPGTWALTKALIFSTSSK